MLKKILIFSFLILSSCSYSQSVATDGNYLIAQTRQENQKVSPITFTKIAPAYKAGEFAFYGTVLLDNNKILSVGYDGENLRNIRISTDSGQTWKTKGITEDIGALADSIYFTDDKHGWIGGGMNAYRTADGGDTWEKSKIGRYLRNTEISFYGLEVGYLTGKHNIEGEIAGEVWVTNDSGQTWKRSYTSKELTTPFSVLAISKNTALAIFDEKNLIRTDDGGKTWIPVKSYSSRTHKLKMDKKGQIWAVGPDNTFQFSFR